MWAKDEAVEWRGLRVYLGDEVCQTPRRLGAGGCGGETGQEHVTGDTWLRKVEEHSDTPGSSPLSGMSFIRSGLVWS